MALTSSTKPIFVRGHDYLKNSDPSSNPIYLAVRRFQLKVRMNVLQICFVSFLPNCRSRFYKRCKNTCFLDISQHEFIFPASREFERWLCIPATSHMNLASPSMVGLTIIFYILHHINSRFLASPNTGYPPVQRSV